MKSHAQFVSDAQKTHGTRYGYANAFYLGANKKLEIVCNAHGVFWQTASSHLRGAGCPKCKTVTLRKAFKKTTAQFIQEARSVHGDRYDYSQADYTSAKTKITIICKAHGAFEQDAGTHLQGFNCPECGNEARRRGRLLNANDVVRRANEIHSDKYEYPLENYADTLRKSTIICPEHGEFRMPFATHLQGQGCPKCGTESRGLKRRLHPDEFVTRAKSEHRGKYDYSKTRYETAKGKVEIVCPAHGSFWQEADSHLHGAGCPNCGTLISKGEREVFEFIRDHCTSDAEQQFKINTKSFDIRADNILIEYHGLYWHSNRNRTEQEAKRLHEARRELAEDHGLRYIAIYEDEWRDRRPVVEAYLRNVFGKAEKAGARDFLVTEVTPKQARKFYDKHHLLGAGAARGKHMALVTQAGQIAACMSVGSPTENRGQHDGILSLSRFCTDGRNISGAASRLFKAFKLTQPVVSYVDLDKFTGGLYATLGFTFDHYIEPDYMSLWGSSAALMHRRHKTATSRSSLAKLDGFDPAKSERENCLAMGIYRIYHSGRVRMLWKPSGLTRVEDLF